MKSNNKAFTLIELLAIIVILAIIAVITVPIILNIIDNSRKGAATDSAYGYKDAVNKAYIQELAKPNNGSLKLDGTYVVQSNGTLNADTGSNFGVTNYTSLPVSVSGDKPSSGKLRYSINVLNAGCLVIGDYKVTFDGNTASTTKGDCEDYEFPVNNPYLTTFDGTYTYTTIGQFESSGNGFVPVAFSNGWTVYLRNDGTKNETCKVFPSGTVCLTNNSTGYFSDFEDCSGDSTYDGTGTTCLKGYTKAKVDEMLSKGADYCFIADGYNVYVSDLSGEHCNINEDGYVTCYNDEGDSDSCTVNSDGSPWCD